MLSARLERTDEVDCSDNKKEGLESRCAFRIGVGRKIHSKTPKPPLTYHVHEINASEILLNFCRFGPFFTLALHRGGKEDFNAGRGASDAIDCGAYYATGVAGSFTTGEESCKGCTLKGIGLTGDSYWA